MPLTTPLHCYRLMLQAYDDQDYIQELYNNLHTKYRSEQSISVVDDFLDIDVIHVVHKSNDDCLLVIQLYAFEDVAATNGWRCYVGTCKEDAIFCDSILEICGVISNKIKELRRK